MISLTLLVLSFFSVTEAGIAMSSIGGVAMPSPPLASGQASSIACGSLELCKFPMHPAWNAHGHTGTPAQARTQISLHTGASRLLISDRSHHRAASSGGSRCFRHRLEALDDSRISGSSLGDEGSFALVLVNYKLQKPLLERLWYNATVRVCADGAINRLYRLFGDDEETRSKFIPEYIRG